jgi:hypothetical protein
MAAYTGSLPSHLAIIKAKQVSDVNMIKLNLLNLR